MKKEQLVLVMMALFGLTVFGQNAKLAVVQEVPQSLPSISDLAAALSPAVVYIENVSRASQLPESHRNPFFREYFGDPDIPRTGSGSGVIVSAEGYIITNYHVVERADEINVTLTDGRVMQATLLGSDPEIDLAVLQIEAEDLIYAALGKSEPVRVGDWVVAIGNPLGYRYTVTFGIVSALGRGNGLNNIENYIQTDAAINRGNSGGPLINMKGQVIGINTAISTAGQNIGFAVPMDLIRPSYEQIVDSGSVSRGALGVRLQPLTPELKEYYGTTKGALVADVPPGPARKAGIEQGDLIVGFNGEEVESTAQLIARVAVNRPGTKVRLKVLRDREERNFSFVLGDRKAIFASVSNAYDPEATDADPQTVAFESLGVTLERMDARQSELSAFEEGSYVITQIERDSPLREKGVGRGQVLVRVNDLEVNANNLVAIRKELSADRIVRLQIRTERGTRLVGVRTKVAQN